MKRKDLILIIVLLAIAGIFYGAQTFLTKKGQQVVVTVDKEVVLTKSLDKDQTIEIPLKHGTNIIKIKNGAVSMTDADCPDQVCVRHKEITKTGETIVCLPHKVVVEIKGKETSDVDIMTSFQQNLKGDFYES